MLAAFSTMAIIIVAVFYDQNPGSKNLQARVHGRVNVAQIMFKVWLISLCHNGSAHSNSKQAMLTLLFTQADRLPLEVLAIVCIIVGASWLYLYWRFLPFFRQGVNVANAAIAALHCWASIVLLVATLRKDDPLVSPCDKSCSQLSQ